MTDRAQPIIAEQTFDASMSTVWEAITMPDLMRQWFFSAIETFEPVIGFKTQFLIQLLERQFTHLWEIIDVVDGRKIVYNWKYEEYPGEGFVTFELFEQDGLTILRLTNEGLESFPDDIPEFARARGVEGWNYFIKESLKEFLDA